jgi:glucosylceramidase
MRKFNFVLVFIAACIAGCGGSGGTTTPITPTAATPTFSPAAGSFTAAQSVTLSDITSGASIYYTTDGTTPTTSSSLYSKAIPVSVTTTIEAIAVATGDNNSAVASGTFTISLPAAAAPTFSPAAGTFTTTRSVTIADATTGASIYYTTDGSTPTASSTLYSAAIPVSTTTTIKAIAAASGFSNSSVASATYTITLPVAAAPTFSPAAGTFTAAQSVILADTTTGASIYYTTDGSTPTASSKQYSSAISVSATTTIKAIAVASGFSNSSVASATYTINLPAAATPTFSPAGGSYTTAQNVTLADTTSGASIYYTTDGSTPSASSKLYSAAIPVSTTTTISAIATAPGASTSAVATATYTFPGSASAVSVVLSTDDLSQLMVTQPSVNFTSSTADGGTNTIVIDPTQTYQSMEGFGAAFTDSAAYLMEKTEPAATLPDTLNSLFSRKGDGIGLNFMRVPMGASDLALSVYSFDDMPSGQTDPTLANFSIAHDQAYILPLIQAAKAVNPDMKLMVNPWSPPGWMKDSGSMLGGSLLMNATTETAFANYFVKYVQAYENAGVPIDYISIQNEPEYSTNGYPSMLMDDTDALAVLHGYVLPALKSANISAKVFAWDHNWDGIYYPEYILGGLTSQELTQMAGTAWHGYGGVPGGQQIVQNAFPTLGTWETEHSGGTWVTDQFASDFTEINDVLRNSAKSYVKWGLALNEKLGPNLTQNAGLGGCNDCTPIITVNSTTGAVTKDVEFYTLGHYSKYVLPGAVRVYSNNTPSITDVAFQNPDGSMTLIAFNDSATSSTFNVQWGTQSFSYTLPSLSAATFTWTGNPTGTTPPIAATAQIQGSSFSSESALETEPTTDSTGEYDLGYISVDASVVYENVDFGSSVSQVSVRTSSGGNGGTATFYLDTQANAPIATATLPVTGSWSTWETVTAPVSGASGVHRLIVVFSGGGSAGLANVNWFQFQ